MSSNQPDKNRNPGIDLLRGISVVLVVFHHVWIRIHLDQSFLARILPESILAGFTQNGLAAVYMFFVISGFLIASNTLSRWGSLSATNPLAFYIRRASRILPCLVALVAILSVLHLCHVKYFVITNPNQSLHGAVLSAFGLYLNWYEGMKGYLPANWDILWSLSIEEVFYLLFPLVCLTLRRPKFFALAMVLFSLSLPFFRAPSANEIWREKAYLPGMAAIAMGIWGAMLARYYEPRSRKIVRFLFGIGIFGLTADLFFAKYVWLVLGRGLLLFQGFCVLCLLLACHWKAKQQTDWVLPSVSWLCSFGKLSYEIYLTHMFVVWPVVHLFKVSGVDLQWGFLFYIPALLFSWALGWLVARFFSVPCERAIRRFLSKNSESRGKKNVHGSSVFPKIEATIEESL